MGISIAILTAGLLLAPAREALSPAPAPAPSPAVPAAAGEYLEVRTCDVWTGPCFANAEANEVGKEAVLAWKLADGRHEGRPLAGLALAALVRSPHTLGDPYAPPSRMRAVLFLDASADQTQLDGLRAFARERLAPLCADVVGEHVVDVELSTGACAKSGCASLVAGDAIEVKTRCVADCDRHCGNESVYYPPLTPVEGATPAVAETFRAGAAELDVEFVERERRGAFTATFAALPAAGLTLLALLDDAAADEPRYAMQTIELEQAAGDDARPEGAALPALPDDVPEAFRERVSKRVLRLSRAADADAEPKPFYDLWLVPELPLAEAKDGGLSIKFPRLAAGTFVGLLHAHAEGRDYRDNPVKAGVHVLRYGLQPADGNHLGTADTRDFLCLTGFQDDEDPAAPVDMAKLEELSILASATEHPTILYLVRPALEPAEEARFYRRPDRDEWIADFHLPARGKGDTEPLRLRFGLVLVGHSEHP